MQSPAGASLAMTHKKATAKKSRVRKQIEKWPSGSVGIIARQGSDAWGETFAKLSDTLVIC